MRSHINRGNEMSSSLQRASTYSQSLDKPGSIRNEIPQERTTLVVLAQELRDTEYTNRSTLAPFSDSREKITKQKDTLHEKLNSYYPLYVFVVKRSTLVGRSFVDMDERVTSVSI
jgi:hypothetical protein